MQAKKTIAGESVLCRETEHGVKYLVFEGQNLVSCITVGNKPGDYETLHSVEILRMLEEFVKD